LETRVVQQFGSVIRARRRQIDLTQKELARRIRTSVPYIGHLEIGKRHPSEKIVTKLAEVLGLDARELFFLANPATKRLITRNQESNGASSWNAFCREETFRKIHNISEQEMQALSGVSLLGEVRSPRDFLLSLTQSATPLVEKLATVGRPNPCLLLRAGVRLGKPASNAPMSAPIRERDCSTSGDCSIVRFAKAGAFE